MNFETGIKRFESVEQRLMRAGGRLTAYLPHFKVSDNTFMVVLAVIIGLVAGLCNYAFRRAIDFFHWLIIDTGAQFTGYTPDTWGVHRLWAISFPLAGAIIMLPLWYFFREDLTFGFAGFLEKVNLRGGKLRLRQMFTRGIAAALTIGSGGSAGQEGPIAQIGGTAASYIGQLLGMSGERLKVLIGCGVSGGVAATFNAPIAGVFFAHEIVLLSSFELSSFTSIVISSGMATVVSRAMFGNTPAFDTPAYQMISPVELFFYAVLGIAAGGLAALFISLYSRSREKFAALRLHPAAKLCLGGFLVGCIGVVLPEVQGNGYAFIERVVSNDTGWLLLTVLIAGKMLATCITIGSGLPGGMFAPSLFIGAVTGGSFGFLVNHFFPAYVSTPGAYGLVGMGAYLAAVCHAPMTAIFLLFEMTGSYQVIIPIMISCVIGTSISRHFKKDSIDTIDLADRGIDLHAGKEQNLLQTISVRDAMNPHPEVLAENMTLRQFSAYVGKTRHTSFPLVNGEGMLAGIVTLQDFLGVAFEEGLEDLVILKDLATTDVITVTADGNLSDALERIGYRDVEYIPVVGAGNDKKIIGVLSRHDIFAAYNRAIMARTLQH